MKAYREFAVVAYGLAVGVGFVWLFGFAVGGAPAIVEFLLFALAVGFTWLGWKLDHS